MKTTTATNRKQKHEKTEKNKEKTDAKSEKPSLRYGPMPRFPHQRVWSRGIIIVGVLIYIWYFSKGTKETTLAAHKDNLRNRGQQFECDIKYLADIKAFHSCIPKRCGRFVTDMLISSYETAKLLEMAKTGLALGGSKGGASILDIHSGALSVKEKFVNIHSIPKSTKVYTKENLDVYTLVKEKIKHAIAQVFEIDANSLYLTHPTFFSKLTNDEPKSVHDEYWHLHVDKDTYESFHYTSLLYLSDYGVDFKGGRFIFRDEPEGETPANVTVEPKMGRVSMFSSGAENTHFVERVISGTRYAITVSFTCDTQHAIDVPKAKN